MMTPPLSISAIPRLTLAVPTGDRRFPMLWETKRISPGQSNTFFFEAVGMEGGVRFSTRSPQMLERFSVVAVSLN